MEDEEWRGVEGEGGKEVMEGKKGEMLKEGMVQDACIMRLNEDDSDGDNLEIESFDDD